MRIFFLKFQNTLFLWLFSLWMAMCSFVCICMEVWYQHRCLTHLLSTLPSETGLEFTERLDGLGSKGPTSLVSASPALDCRPDSTCLAFYVSNRDPYWGPHIWAVSTLSTELTPAPSFYNFNVSSTDCTIFVRENIYGFDVCFKYLTLHHQSYPNFTQCEKERL